MRPRRVYTDYLRDILDAIDKALQFVDGLDYDAFRSDHRTNFAVVRALTIIGEAAKKIPRALRERYSEIPWREVTGMRDKVIHEYFGVDLRRVWDTVQRDLPPLRPAIERMLEESVLEANEGS